MTFNSVFKPTSHSESSEVKIMSDEMLTRQVGLMEVPSRTSPCVQNQSIRIKRVEFIENVRVSFPRGKANCP